MKEGNCKRVNIELTIPTESYMRHKREEGKVLLMYYSSTYGLYISLVTFILHTLSNNKTTLTVVVDRVSDFMHIYLFQMSVYASMSKRHEFRLILFQL